MRRWHWHAVKWAGLSGLGLAVAIVAGLGALLFWLAASYSRTHPLDLDPYLPRIEKYLAGRGLPVSIGHLEIFYDESPIIRVSDIAIMGPGGEAGVYVEQAAIKLANRRVLMFQVSPKVVEAKGVTLRIVRDDSGVGIYGLDSSGKSGGDSGMVEWLNGLAFSGPWARLKDVKIDKVNLLLRDKVLGTEWVLENGRMVFTRYPDDGERGTLTASIRRLSGADRLGLKEGAVMPVLVTFDHKSGEKEARLSAKFDETEVGLVADYLPEQLQDLLRAQGSVEIGTTLRPGNALSRPWVTLRLADVVLQPPAGFSKPLEFPRLTMTASYEPSPTDVLEVMDLAFMSRRGNIWSGKGKVDKLTSDPVIDMSLDSEVGDVQGIFDFFPDKEQSFQRALEFLRPNIRNAAYEGLHAYVHVRAGAFPHCGDACGTIEIDAKIPKGTVKFLPELSAAELVSPGTFIWRGEQFHVLAPRAKLADQQVRNLTVTLNNMFSPDPTHVLVSGTLVGGVEGVLAELRKLDDTGQVPKHGEGSHVSLIGVDVPLPHGRDATFHESTVTVSSTLRDVAVSGLEELGDETFSAPVAQVMLFPDKTLRVSGEGKLGGNPVKVVWQKGIDDEIATETVLNVSGRVDGAWLLARAGKVQGVSLTGVLGVAANLVKSTSGKWRFGVKADGGNAAVGLAKLDYSKKVGEALAVETQGVLAPDGGVRLDSLQVKGRGVNVAGKVDYDPKKADDVKVYLSPFVMGGSDVVVDYANRALRISGKKLDLSGADIFGDSDKADDGKLMKNVSLSLDLDEMKMKGGTLRGVKGNLKAQGGTWDVERLLAKLASGSTVSIQTTPMKGGRRKMMLNIDDLGATLATVGLYDRLKGGKLWGDIVYDTPKTGSGTLKMSRFELDNPPVLVKLLGLVSLEQLLAGTDTILFDNAVLPVRMSGDVVALRKVLLEGPSMSIQLDGEYDRKASEMNFDGRLAPAIPLNRLVSKIPLLGTILTGSQEGLVVVDFKLKGPSSDPDINVRPLSVLTPGLVKDFWRGLTGSH